MPNNEAQFLETRKFQVSEICRIYRVPPHMIGDLDRATFSNIENQSISFAVHTINRDIDRLVDMKTAARASINQIANPDERLILELRYLCYKTWPEIAESMCFCESHIHRLHGFALLNFAVPPDPMGRDWSVTGMNDTENGSP